MRSHDDSGLIEACTDLSPDACAEMEANFRAVVEFWMRVAGLPDERACAIVEDALNGWLERVTAVCGRIPDELVEQHCATYLRVLAAEVAEYEAGHRGGPMETSLDT